MILAATVGPEQAGMRLDDGAKALFPQLSKGEIRRIIDWGGCTVSNTLARVASRALKEGEELVLGVMEQERRIDLVYRREDLLYEDSSFMAINKAPGINSQRTPYQLKGTVEYAVSVYLRETGIKEPARVIHRLDRGTSGVMFFPKNKRAATHISLLLKEGRVEKVYWALVDTLPDEERWTVDAPIAKLNKFRYGVAFPGKEAVTHFRTLAAGSGAVLVEARPVTGRTHQIRVHLTHCGLPILGDTTYGGASAPRMMLHCRQMCFRSSDGRKVSAVAPVDPAFLEECRARSIDLSPLLQPSP
ncbi:RluA family pseudouridine synthase [Geobacter sp. DSM 9736]|uniref:RluA family pseudouridine synthase n=1 Tax=Geobacter sp. DSM 9736 TaxID=1277350 RepID=UPI000B503DC3|nr:RluA family pseudouridine synthase [Geobacter sp. DSM 9736]SNB47450.1 pseudouridine synthase, RluA family [Geobacter sp. DSM 9736]